MVILRENIIFKNVHIVPLDPRENPITVFVHEKPENTGSRRIIAGDAAFTVNTVGGSLWRLTMVAFFHPHDHCFVAALDICDLTICPC